MKRYVAFILFTWSVFVDAQNVNTDFQTYRKGLLGDYQKYRKKVLDDYSDYLAAVWKEYQSFKGEKRNDIPKPIIVPNVENVPVCPLPQALPAPEIKPKEVPDVSVVPHNRPIEPIRPIGTSPFEFDFYGVSIGSVKIMTYDVPSLDHTTISVVWKKYQTDDNRGLILSLKSISQNYGLNDWLIFELVRRYVDSILSNGTSSDRIVLQHYILANLGFDIRLARTQRQLLLLMPCKQQVYERSYLKIDGHKYYIFYDNISPITESSMAVYTCDLPKDIEKGNILDLLFNRYPLSIKSGKDYNRILTDGHIKVRGTVNSGMMEMLRRYPQMDVPCYAASKVVPSFHANILEQIRPQISGMNQKQAANVLLHFVQYAFEYATDDDQHGYEKAYFIEENFYYPKNDCEDRAIFYAFLIRGLLNLDVHLIRYPGHECTAVNFTDQSITGDRYIYNEKVYIICDPTYIGASVGQCMPGYLHVQPKIEEWY